MAKHRVCKECGKKIGHKLFCYSSGSGCLTVTWREDTPKGDTVSREVTQKDCQRLLDTEKPHLVNWLPVQINGQWVLANHVKRLGPNKLMLNKSTFFYTWDKSQMWGAATTVNTQFWFFRKFNSKMRKHELMNQSMLMALRYFLEHEDKLKPQFKDHKQIKTMK